MSRSKDAGACALPNLMDLHRYSEADWRGIFASRPEAAVTWVRFAAGHGFRAAQLVLGQMHLDGHGVARDPEAAYRWFVKAAAIGSVEARNMVGRCHELGWGVPVDHAEALVHYRKAAAAGLDWGHYNVGCLLLYGTGIRRDHAQAFRHLAAAAEQDHAKAMGMLGRCHEEGWGTPVDRATASRLYRAAAEGGDCWGALNLALMLAEAGETDEAVRMLERARATATPNCLDMIARTLVRHPSAAIAAIGQAAERACPGGDVPRHRFPAGNHDARPLGPVAERAKLIGRPGSGLLNLAVALGAALQTVMGLRRFWTAGTGARPEGATPPLARS